MQIKLNIIRSMQEILAETIQQAPEEKVLTLVGDVPLKISREDAEKLNKILEECSKINNEKELYDYLKKEYDEIPYIIGATDESIVGQFQQMLEA